MTHEILAPGIEIYCADCLAVMPTLGKVDAVVTDPPYGINFQYDGHKDSPESYVGGYGKWLMNIIGLAETKCTSGSPIMVWQSAKHIAILSDLIPRKWRLFIAAKNFVQMRPTPMQWAYDPILIWWIDQGKPWSAGTASRDFFVANTAPIVASPDNIEKGHPCPRPLDLVLHLIDQWVDPESIVLDMFMGSGTTGVAAVKLGRKFIGIEISPEYYAIAKARLVQAIEEREMDMFKEPAPEPEQSDLLAGIKAGRSHWRIKKPEPGLVTGTPAADGPIYKQGEY